MTCTLILEHDRAAIFHGDSSLLDLPEHSVDAIVCDPPAAISFMGRGWDDDRGGYDGWTKWLAGVLAPAVRALRPGGYALLWALPRTSHWTARAVELAGLEIRDVHHEIIAVDDVLQEALGELDDRGRAALARVLEVLASPAIVYQTYGTGFPKSLNISKAIDDAAGAERPVIGQRKKLESYGPNDVYGSGPDHGGVQLLTAPATAAAAWTGYGTSLKPAVEHWVLARKPLEGTYVENVLEHGTGALNIDACRIGSEGETFRAPQSDPANRVADRSAADIGCLDFAGCSDVEKMQAAQRASTERLAALGRWPAHLSLRHASGCAIDGTTSEQVASYANVGDKDRDDNATNFAMGRQTAGEQVTITHDRYRCAPGCPVAELDAQSGERVSGARKAGARKGIGYKANVSGDGGPAIQASTGGASRFFYVAKPSRREKDAGLAHLQTSTGGEATNREDGSAGLQSPRAGAGRTGGARNSHETVKSIALMTWLIRLVVPDPKTLGRAGVVLDPFAGSGTTGVAALGLGHDFIGAEQGGEKDRYIPILLGRIRHALGLPPT